LGNSIIKESGGISVPENGTLNSFCPYHIFIPLKKRKRGGIFGIFGVAMV